MDRPASPPYARGRSAPGAWLGRTAETLAALSWRWAALVLAGAAVLTILFGLFAAEHLKMDTQTSRLLDPALEWRQKEIAYNDAFPQGKRTLVVVVETDSPARAAAAAERLSDALARQTDLFQSVSYPEGSDFFRRNGLLLQNLDRVRAVSDQLIEAAGLLGPFAADPSLRGLFDALNRALAGVKDGAIEPSLLDRPLSAIADTIARRRAGEPAYLSWSRFLSAEPPSPRERLRVITLKPVLDHATLAPGRAAREAVTGTAASLGIAGDVQLHFTGDVALNDEELASVTAGMGLATLLSSLLVLAVLFIAIRSPKAVLAILIILAVGLVWALAFAAATVQVLNLVSVAFVVMFIGLAVDFGIQFCVRYRDEQTRTADAGEAIRRTGAGIGGALGLAALVTAIGFLAFAPTAYRGVSELGLIAGAGMLIALLLNLTLLPALLRYLSPRPAGAPPHLFRTARADEWIIRNRRAVLAGSAVLILAGAALLPRLTFDFNPLNLKDPEAASVRTLNRLIEAGLAAPNAMQLLVPDRASIGPIVKRLRDLPEVGRVISIESFIPQDQDKKLAILADAAFLLAPALGMGETMPPPRLEDIRESARDMASRLRLLAPGAPPSYTKLAEEIDWLLAGGETRLATLEEPLIGALRAQLAGLPLLLDAEAVRFDTLPEDLKRNWIAPDGRFRVEIRPKDAALDNEGLSRFVHAVQGVAPDAIGGAYTIEKSGDAVWMAFRQAFFYALVGIVAVLALILRRAVDVALIVGPLLAAALLTLGLTVLIGLPINFANVIALPLLMGIGVAFNIYFVTNWRLGLTRPLQSSTARAVLFSALTTLCAVASLAVSPHRGTASMGQLLTLCLTVTLVAALVLLPALLAFGERDE